MKAPQLPALEKNVLKYRALQMVLLLQEYEPLKRYVIGSLRASDRLPIDCKKPLETALNILVSESILAPEEKSHILEFSAFRNRIGHEVHKLVADVSRPDLSFGDTCLHDYWALTKLERLRVKISDGMMSKFIQQLSFEDLIFEQAELTYKEELARLERKINRQISARLSRPVPNNSFNRKPLRGSG
jgi:hypothetical protein